jgi:hypothetical protein
LRAAAQPARVHRARHCGGALPCGTAGAAVPRAACRRARRAADGQNPGTAMRAPRRLPRAPGSPPAAPTRVPRTTAARSAAATARRRPVQLRGSEREQALRRRRLRVLRCAAAAPPPRAPPARHAARSTRSRARGTHPCRHASLARRLQKGPLVEPVEPNGAERSSSTALTLKTEQRHNVGRSSGRLAAVPLALSRCCEEGCNSSAPWLGGWQNGGGGGSTQHRSFCRSTLRCCAPPRRERVPAPVPPRRRRGARCAAVSRARRMAAVRHPSHAGSWYESDGARAAVCTLPPGGAALTVC